MKLTCELCGGSLQVTSGKQGAVCTNCGLEYTREHLTEMLNGVVTASSDTVVNNAAKPSDAVKTPQMRKLFLKRKFNLGGSTARIVFFLDGEKCAVLGPAGETSVPVSQGKHELIVQVVNIIKKNMEPIEFEVTDKDLYGLFFVRQGPKSAGWAFEFRDHF